MQKRALLFLPLLLACGEPPKDDTAADTLSPYEMPDRSGCTYDLAYDIGADGTPDWTQTNTYDDEERVVSYALDYLDEVRYRHFDYTYDDAGCLVAYAYEDVNEAEGTSSTTSAVSSCDEHGSLVWAEYTTTTGDDEPLVFTYEYTYTYDGELIVEKLVSLSFDGADTVTIRPNRYTYTYDDAGLLLEERAYDEDTLMSAEGWSWLAEDKPLTAHYASDTIVRDEAWDYDAHDREVGETYEAEFEGERTAWYTTRTWDEAHYRALAAVTDVDIDGTPDATWTYSCEGGWPWSCDGALDGGTDGDPAYPHDGAVDHTFRYAYTCG